MSLAMQSIESQVGPKIVHLKFSVRPSGLKMTGFGAAWSKKMQLKDYNVSFATE